MKEAKSVNKWRRFPGYLLLFFFVLTLSGCSPFQTEMAKTTSRMANLKSFHTDVEMTADVILHIGGQTIREEAAVTGGFDTVTDPFLIRTGLQLEMLGVERDLRFYIYKDTGVWTLVPWNEDRSINEVDIAPTNVKRPKTVQALKLLVKCGDYFDDPVDDAVNGAPAKRYDGVLPEELVREALVLLDLQEKESSDPPEDAADSDGIPDGILPGSIWVNGEDQIVRVEMDLAMFLQELFDEGLTELLNEFDLGGLKLDAEIRSVPARLTFSGFDEYNLLRLPEY